MTVHLHGEDSLSRLRYTVDVIQEMRQRGFTPTLSTELRASLEAAYKKGLTPQQFVEQLQHTPEAA